MAQLIHRKVARYASALLAGALIALYLGPVHADTEEVGDIQVESSVTSEFPDGIRVKVQASGKSEIKSVAIRFRVGQRSRGVYDYLCPAGSLRAQTGLQCEDIEPALAVDGELFWRTDTISRYIPPGTIITYNFEIEDSEATHKTGRAGIHPTTTLGSNGRMSRKDRSLSPITAGQVARRARSERHSSDFGRDGAAARGQGSRSRSGSRMYNNVKEMLGGLPPGSTTIRRELITAGQAFSDAGTLLTLAAGATPRVAVP